MNRIPGLKSSTLLATVVSCALGLGPMSAVRADEKTDFAALEIIVPWGVGGGADRLAQETGKLFQSALNTAFKITHIPGKTGYLGMEKLFESPSDGRLLSVLTAETYCLLAYANPGWKASDMVPLAIMMRQSSALFLPTTGRFNNWQEFEKEARQKPRSLRVAISGFGSPDYLTLQQLYMKGIQLVPVSFENPEQRYQAVLNGQADALYEQPADVIALIESKQLLTALFFTPARLPDYKEVPASGEFGYSNGLPQFRAIVARAGTDPAKLKSLAQALERIAGTPEYKGFLKQQLATDDSFIPAKSALAFMQNELKDMQQIVDTLPLHARHLWDGQVAEAYVEQF